MATAEPESSRWEEVSRRLREPFHEGEIEWKPVRFGEHEERGGWAQMLAFVTNRAIQNRLDLVVGAGNWRNEYVRWGDDAVLCGLSIRVSVDRDPIMPGSEWVTKWDGADESDIEATKGGLSNSMKRAAAQWGIGRYLYLLGATFVKAKIWKKGNTLTGKPLERPKLKPEFLPGGTLPDAEIWNEQPSDPSVPSEERKAAPAPAGRLRLPAGGEPSFLDEPVGFGKWKEKTWRWMASGSEGGDRESWLLFCRDKFNDGKKKDMVSAVLAWRASRKNG